mmetsp:Transcript_36282/g.58634  ORF Transcript_36282/g.58634 Transcript_36282/m.58634 type:complete len:159 (-) Transcript_36282:40-516(-)
MQTAHAVAVLLNVPLKIEYGVCEWLNKNWFDTFPKLIFETESIEDVKAKFPKLDIEYKTFYRPTFPERYNDVQKRAQETASHVVKEYCVKRGETILFAGHGATVEAFVSAVLGRKINGEPTYTALSKLVPISDTLSWKAEYINDETHTRGIKSTSTLN